MPEERPPPRNQIESIANFVIALFDVPVTWVRGKCFQINEKRFYYNRREHPKAKKSSNEKPISCKVYVIKIAFRVFMFSRNEKDEII